MEPVKKLLPGQGNVHFLCPGNSVPPLHNWRAGVQRGAEFPGYIRGEAAPPGRVKSPKEGTERGRVFHGKHTDFVGICVSAAYAAVASVG